jgi:L-ascorbate metabolism protein UlaG (beta-lactamase superfamily)
MQLAARMAHMTKQGSNEMKVTWFGHSAFRVEFGDTVILIDPFLSGNPKFEGSVEKAAAGCTHVILTHGHDDHIGDTVEICKATGATLCAVYELAVHLHEQGVEKFDPANTGGAVYHKDFMCTFVRADHSSSSGGVYLGNPCGVVIRPHADGAPVLYHVGDTDIFGDMRLIAQIYQPTIGIVPIGDRFTMNPITASTACRHYFDFKTVIPCHYGTFPLLIPDADPFVNAMADKADRVKVPYIGQTLDLSASV